MFRLLLIGTFILSSWHAHANTDLTLSSKPMFLQIQLPPAKQVGSADGGEWRRVNVVLVSELPRSSNGLEQYGLAYAASGSGVCMVYIRRDKLQYLWHELDHCRGEEHPG